MSPTTLASVYTRTARTTTTIRLDTILKKQAEEYARMNHMDFTTFLSFSIKNTMQYGGKIEPYYTVSDQFQKELDSLYQRIDRNNEPMHGPFEGKDAIDFLKNSI
jgi:hypothetical protein